MITTTGDLTMLKKSLTIALFSLTGITLSTQSLAASGEEVYKGICFACHATGVANAPKLGDKVMWEPRLAKGMDALYENSIKGLNAMPPKGGATNYSDDEIKAAVDYMVESAK
jgi:cytochrome c5